MAVLLPALAAAAVIGIVKVGPINPIAFMTARYEGLENQILRNRDNFAASSKGGLASGAQGDGDSVCMRPGSAARVTAADSAACLSSVWRQQRVPRSR